MQLTLFFSLFAAGIFAAEVNPECTITHPTTKEFYDLRGLARYKDEENVVDWHANGFDYKGNFSINICAPLIHKVPSKFRGNVSAIYTDEDDDIHSIGQTSTNLTFRGKKLVLKYEDGSTCPGDTNYRKSTLILFTCDASMIGTASVNFIGQLNDCSYFFEYKTSRACATTRDVEAALSPAHVFLIIFFIAIGVYFVGGCMYSRTVLHQTGWKQLPNHELWQGLFGFVGDILVIAVVTVVDRTKSVLRLCGIGRNNGYIDARYERDDADNQLIDDIEDDRW